MISKWAYILIGDDMTGKTTFQKYLIWHLCGIDKFDRLYTNLVHPINHRNAMRKFKTLFTINRSIQEKMGEYESVERYFEVYFKEADVVILSSHAHDDCIEDVRIMIEELAKRYYNVCAVFFSNHLNPATAIISNLHWHERIVIDNPYNPDAWEQQINDGSRYFGDMILAKTSIF